MKYIIKITTVTSIDELEVAWTDDDYTELLKRFDYADANKLKPSELKEYLMMAIPDFEPEDAAAIVLNYRLSDALAEGQIGNISNEMLREKVYENYSDIYLHRELFNINQLLYKAYNGKFPAPKATLVEFEMTSDGDQAAEVNKELALKAISAGLSPKNLITRLFREQLEGNGDFAEAEGIIWELVSKGDSLYRLITSEKWLTREDFEKYEFEATITPSAEKVEKV